MLIISHRGNLSGKDLATENKPEHLVEVMQRFSVEVDLRVKNDKLYFGHDEAQYEINHDFLNTYREKLWVHCKDKEAFEFALKDNLNCFWHQTDDYTITSKGYVWAYPGKERVGSLCIIAVPEVFWTVEETKNKHFLGVCTDYPLSYQ